MKKALSNKYQYDDLLIRSVDPYATAKYEIILDWLKKRKIKTILNAGCGSGEFSIMLASNGYEIDSFDMDKDYISLAKKNVKNLGLDYCKFTVSSIDSFGSGKNYDVVVANDVLEHIEDDKEAIKKLASLVKKGGYLVITVPAGQYLFGFHDEKLGHYRRYCKYSFRKITPNDLREIKFVYFGASLIPVCVLYSKLLRKSYPVSDVGGGKKNGIVQSFLTFLLNIEKRFSFGFGTSLIYIAKKG